MAACADKLVANITAAERRKLELVVSLIGAAPLVLLDEVCTCVLMNF